MNKVKQSMPTANIAINNSRIKVYEKNSDMPTYYLQKGQEFQIELFNPTSDIILAKISLNNKAITQGGLVLKPGQRVFLDRYIDVAKKFKFDTYEVSNTSEVKEAIKENGDFKVDFYKEKESRPILRLDTPVTRTYYNQNINDMVFGSTSSSTVNLDNLTLSTDTTYSNTSIGGSSALRGAKTNVNFDKTARLKSRSRKSTSIETGRVEMGSTSDQELKTVNYDFEYFSFHTITYKMLPVSQKVNTVKDVKVAKYCTECGNKQKPTNKFCPKCGSKQ